MLKVAIVFTIGCIILATNSVLCFMPFISLQVKLPYRMIYVEGILSVLSCGVFVIGSALAFLEVLNANAGRRGFLGWKLEQPRSATSSTDAILEKGPELEAARPESVSDGEYEGQLNEKDSSDHEKKVPMEYPGSESEKSTPTEPPLTEQQTFEPTWTSISAGHGLRAQYCELGLIASGIFLLSSLTYCATAIAGLATTLQYGHVARSIRYPQLVAASGFAVASLLLIIKAQKHSEGKWWKPAVHSLGWYVNLWNLAGSAGFFFCAYFGLFSNTSWAEFQFGCSYLWGSWSLLFGSAIQWYRARRKKNVIILWTE